MLMTVPLAHSRLTTSLLADSRLLLWAYYNCDSSWIRLQHAATRYEVFRALAYDIDSSTPRESVVGVSCMLIDSSMHTTDLFRWWEIDVQRVEDYIGWT